MAIRPQQQRQRQPDWRATYGELVADTLTIAANSASTMA